MDVALAFAVLIFPILMVFARIGTFVMVMPALSASFVSARFRLALAMALSVALAPVIPTTPAPVPLDVGGLVPILAGEMIIGLFMGLVSRSLLHALSMAGQIIGQSIGLSNIFMLPGMGDEVASALSSLFAVTGMVIFLVTDLHHLAIQAAAASFKTLPIGEAVEIGLLAERLAGTLQYSVTLAAALSAPFLVLGFLFYLAVGLINRMMMSLPVFFISLPLALGGGIAVLMVLTGAIFSRFAQGMRDGILLFGP
ncbi:MAG: flagellar biosynthetic protein FliR [Alphaproteobacteria bacterium]